MYEWDSAKRAASLRKHGVDFAAMAGFDWETAITRAMTTANGGSFRSARLMIDCTAVHGPSGKAAFG